MLRPDKIVRSLVVSPGYGRHLTIIGFLCLLAGAASCATRRPWPALPISPMDPITRYNRAILSKGAQDVIARTNVLSAQLAARGHALRASHRYNPVWPGMIATSRRVARKVVTTPPASLDEPAVARLTGQLNVQIGNLNRLLQRIQPDTPPLPGIPAAGAPVPAPPSARRTARSPRPSATGPAMRKASLPVRQRPAGGPSPVRQRAVTAAAIRLAPPSPPSTRPPIHPPTHPPTHPLARSRPIYLAVYRFYNTSDYPSTSIEDIAARNLEAALRRQRPVFAVRWIDSNDLSRRTRDALDRAIRQERAEPGGSYPYPYLVYGRINDVDQDEGLPGNRLGSITVDLSVGVIDTATGVRIEKVSGRSMVPQSPGPLRRADFRAGDASAGSRAVAGAIEQCVQLLCANLGVPYRAAGTNR